MRNFYNHIVNFFKGMFAADGGLSSKRVVGFGCFLIIVEIGIGNIWFKKTIDSEYLYVVAGLIATCFGMNTVLSSKSIESKSSVASNIIKEKPSPEITEDVKDVLNSPKP